MKYELLGKTNMNVSKITFGCWELGGTQWELTSDEINLQALQVAFENGITSFDTAEGYGNGHSEEIVGKALAGKRGKCIIASKVSPKNLRASDVRKSIENSLRGLKTDYLDIYYIHWPNEEIPMEETMSEFNKLKKEGLIRAIGVSNFNLEQLVKISKLGQIDVLQSEYSLLQRNVENGILKFCAANSISFFSYSSLAKGLLTGAYHLDHLKIKEEDFRATRRLFLKDHLEKETELIYLMKKMAQAKGAKISQIAISWLLQQKGQTSAIVGTQSEKHLLENILSVEVGLSSDEIEQLNQVSSKVLENIRV